MTVKSGISGGAELQARLASLPNNMVQNILRKAIRQGANLIAEKARTNFTAVAVQLGADRSDSLNPRSLTGALRGSIRVVARRGTPTRVVFNVVAGALSEAQKAKFGTDSAYYALWVERGHINRKMHDALRGSRAFKLHQRSVSESNTPAHPYMAPAVESEGSAVIELIRDSLRTQVDQL
jgi:hypothetical protein